MNIIDIIIILIIGLSALRGWNRGFILSLFSFFKIFIAIIIARAIYPYLVEFLNEYTGFYPYIKEYIYPKINSFMNNEAIFSADIITNLIISLFIMIFLYFIINIVLSVFIRIVDGFFKLPVLKSFNKFIGFLFGAIKGILIVFIIYALLTPVIVLNTDSFISVKTHQSILGNLFYNPDVIINYLQSNFLYLINLL